MNKTIQETCDGIGSGLILAYRAFASLPSAPRIIKRVVEQAYIGSYTSLPIVAILSFFIGAVLALQTGITMAGQNMQAWIGTIVGQSITRELGPVMVAIILAGRVGSAITAELASMKVYQEVDALVTMNIPPERFLVLPRLLAVIIFMPFLTLVGIIIGWIGGAVICKYVQMISVSPEIYFRSLSEFLTTTHLRHGLIKAEVFGFVVVLTACNTGLRTRGGPREIGASVTRSVVLSLILILVLDYFITKVLA
jgi:phospholipid/cholesterol/gamma-HCH transport system permease protein